MSNPGTTVSIQSHLDQKPRKVTKLVPYKDGGFALLAPYHSAREGFVAKLPVDYNHIGFSTISLEDVVRFTADDRVKLSYHADGFAQFSSENSGKIISGRDSATGKPKGVGLITSPLSNPIRTGPSMGITLWGLEDFDELRDSNKSLTFSPEDVYYRSCTPDTATGWVLEFFVFPNRYWAGVRQRGDTFTLTLSFRDFEASGTVMELKVIPLPGQDCFIGVVASRLPTQFPSKSGWVLCGPGERDPVTGKGDVLNAFYPRSVCMSEGATSLDRNQ